MLFRSKVAKKDEVDESDTENENEDATEDLLEDTAEVTLVTSAVSSSRCNQGYSTQASRTSS